MASKQVATTAGAMLSAAGKPKIFTDAKGRQFMVLKYVHVFSIKILPADRI